MTTNDVPASDDPSPEEVRAQVDRMVVSDVFARSQQLGAFLRFVVEAVLNNRRDGIKAYTIGVEVFRRDTRFDPQLDPIVRVEATRLRRTIERYYTGPGADDPLLIDLPRGAYVPTIRRRSEITVAAPTAGPSGRSRRLLAFAVFAALALGAVVAGVAALRGNQSLEGTRRPGNGMPVLVLHAIEGKAPPAAAISAASLTERLRDAFPRFDAINVVYQPTQEAKTRAKATPPADYEFFGGVDSRDDQSTTLRFRLQENAGNRVVWSRTFEQVPATAEPAAAEETVVRELAQVLLQPFGVIRANDRVRQLASSEGDPRYRCVIEASEALRSIEREQRQRARACLERLIAADPGFVIGARYQAAIDLREFLFGDEAGDMRVIDRALKWARHAVELQPESSRGYHTLAAVLFARHDLPQSYAAGDRAVALNRYDMLVLGDYGGRLIAAGEVDRGMAMLLRADGPYAVRPASHHFFLFLAYYLGGDLANADYQADQITGETFPLGLIARALAANAAGEDQRSRQALEQLMSLQPGWRDNPRAQLERFFPAPAVVERLLAGLKAAGLRVPQ